MFLVPANLRKRTQHEQDSPEPEFILIKLSAVLDRKFDFAFKMNGANYRVHPLLTNQSQVVFLLTNQDQENTIRRWLVFPRFLRP